MGPEYESVAPDSIRPPKSNHRKDPGFLFALVWIILVTIPGTTNVTLRYVNTAPGKYQ